MPEIVSKQAAVGVLSRSAAAIVSASLAVLAALALVGLASLPALGEQSKEQCERCCQNSGFDEYYLEQCRLKCFRNPDHCQDRGAPKKPATAAPEASPTPPPVRTAPPRQAGPPAAQPGPPPVQTGPPPQYQGPQQPGPPPQAGPPQQPPATARPPRAGPGDVVFQWPNPLNLVPGKEFEAAGQILGANGITPQHPGYSTALRAVEQVLVDFARNNPAGGRLPTDQLVRILMQFR